MPGGRLDRSGVSGETLPKRLHGLQLLFNAHFVQREHWNAHSSNYITRVSKIDILKEGMKKDARKRMKAEGRRSPRRLRPVGEDEGRRNYEVRRRNYEVTGRKRPTPNAQRPISNQSRRRRPSR